VDADSHFRPVQTAGSFDKTAWRGYDAGRLFKRPPRLRSGRPRDERRRYKEPAMSQGTSHTTHAKTSSAGSEVKHAAAEEHKVAKAAHKVDSTIYEAQVVASGNPKRIERYFLRKIAYKLFGKFMGKTVNRI
jgi:hypothetical protein